MFMCVHVYDVACCDNTVVYMTLVSDWLATPVISYQVVYISF